MSVLDRLHGGLVVSVQAEAGSALDSPAAIAMLARVAEQNGAAAVRIEGEEHLRAVRAAIGLPIVGIVKRADEGFAPYITSTVADVETVLRTGAEIVAFDATARARSDGSTVATLCARVHAAGKLAMADCSSIVDGRLAIAAGCDLVATTLAGYTAGTRGRALPALDIVGALHSEHPFIVCEGGIASPDAARDAFAAGARAIVVGTAITNVDAIVRSFVAACGLGGQHRP